MLTHFQEWNVDSNDLMELKWKVIELCMGCSPHFATNFPAYRGHASGDWERTRESCIIVYALYSLYRWSELHLDTIGLHYDYEGVIYTGVETITHNNIETFSVTTFEGDRIFTLTARGAEPIR